MLRLIDSEGEGFAEAVRRLRVSRPTAERAYAHAHRDDISGALGKGQKFRTPRTRKLKPADEQRVVRLKAEGEPLSSIAETMKCSPTTVWSCLARLGKLA